MSTLPTDAATSAALWIVARATVLLGAAALLQAVAFRRNSAAMRHQIWTLALAGVFLLPLLSMALPDWTLVIRTAPTSTGPERSGHAPDDSPGLAAAAPLSTAAAYAPASPRAAGFSWSWSAAIGGLYAAGVIVLLIHLAMQRWSVRRLARGATDVRDPEWRQLLAESARAMGVRAPVRLLRSRERTLPMAFGIRIPSILIPAIADTWSEDRRRAVIRHELAHVVRRDCLTQTLAFAACTMYWFHPAAWWAARRMRIERELACDDRVIAAGTQPREYAGHLLEIAYSFGNHRAPALAVSMARPRQLEGRMLAALDAARDRRAPAFRVRVAATAIAAALLLTLAGATPAIVESDAEPDRAPVPPPSSAVVVEQGAVIGPELKRIDGPWVEPARRLVNSAAALVGMLQDNLPGTWELRPTSTEGTVHLRLAEGNSSSGSNLPIAQLDGLTAGQLAGAGGPVQFRLRRDAGTFAFQGVLSGGVGAGTYSFTPDPAFPGELAKRGFARPTAREQYQMARHDVGYAFVDELNKQGYAKPETGELVRAGQHGVSVAYVRDMGTLGYRLGSLAPLIELRDHGVTPAYVRELGEQGYKGLPADDLRRARDHGVTPDYVRAMREAGYSSLPIEDLIEAKDHGVSAQFVRELGDAGHRTLPLDELIRVRDHGVSPEYAREMRQLGHAVPVAELVRARDHGVGVEFARDLAALGYGNLPLESLIRLRDHGVTPAYAQELKALGYDRLPIEDLVMLRDSNDYSLKML